jgi:hypothetical protein
MRPKNFRRSGVSVAQSMYTNHRIDEETQPDDW